VIDANSGASLSRQIGKIWDNSQAAGRKAAQDRGNSFHMIPAAELTGLGQGLGAAVRRLGGRHGQAGLPGQQMLQDARELLAKYRK
jgi:hypothetical protein